MKKTILRILVAFIAAMGFMIAVCGYADATSPFPRWADFCCGHNAPLQLFATIPVFYGLLAGFSWIKGLRMRRETRSRH